MVQRLLALEPRESTLLTAANGLPYTAKSPWVCSLGSLETGGGLSAKLDPAGFFLPFLVLFLNQFPLVCVSASHQTAFFQSYQCIMEHAPRTLVTKVNAHIRSQPLQVSKPLWCSWTKCLNDKLTIRTTNSRVPISHGYQRRQSLLSPTTSFALQHGPQYLLPLDKSFQLPLETTAFRFNFAQALTQVSTNISHGAFPSGCLQKIINHSQTSVKQLVGL